MEDKYPSHSSGAMREGLEYPYFRQVPLEAVAAGAASLEYGAKKYAHRNWEKGLPWQQLIDSLKRHIDDFERRKEYDESGLPQICMIMASAMMLCSSVIRDIGVDDRLPDLDNNAMDAKQCSKWMLTQLSKAKINNDTNTD
jgi:hypothetical protein